MYQLTLTSDERKAMDFAGHRYFYGNDLFQLLWSDCHVLSVKGPANDPEWDSKDDIIFMIPENVAWEIVEGLKSEDYCLALGSGEFEDKLRAFCERIV